MCLYIDQYLCLWCRPHRHFLLTFLPHGVRSDYTERRQLELPLHIVQLFLDVQYRLPICLTNKESVCCRSWWTKSTHTKIKRLLLSI